MNNNTTNEAKEFIDDSSFIANLEASTHILAGNIDEARNVLSKLDENFILLTVKRCKFLLKRDKSLLSANQKSCLIQKIELCNSLLT